MNDSEENELEFDLAGYLDLFLRRIWVVLSVWAAVVIIVALVTFNTRPVYQSSGLLVIEKERGGTANVYQGGPTVERSNEDYYQTQYKLLKSETLLKVVYEKLNLSKIDDFAAGPAALNPAVIIAPVPRSRLVYIRVNSHVPQISANIANAVASVFIDQNLSNQLFISKDVLNALQNNQSMAESRKLFESLPAVVNNSLIQQLKKDASGLRAQSAELASRYTARHPQVLSISANLEAVENQIRNETDKIIQSLKIDLSGQLMGNNIRLIDPAIPAEIPIKPRKMLNLLLALVGGLVLGFFAAVLVDMIDQTLRTQEDVEHKLKLPFLGIIPLTHQSKDKTVYGHILLSEHSLTSEAIRNLRTMVDFAEVSQKSKSFMVTSSVQGEGKSYICANLAVAMARAGEKVIIVDGDLRRSTLHRVFRVANSSGLSGFLAAGRNIEDLKPLIQKSDVDNLSILTCGPRPPNPAELLNTPRLSAFLAWAGAEYDRVIIDCPPIFPISDALLWGKYISSCVFVSKFGKTRVPLIKTATRQMVSSGIKILGTVINMSKFGGLAYSYYGSHYYKYKYNYHYGHEDSETKDSSPRTPPAVKA
jgi:capsular exopolysaccharide synthesis family protein